MHLFLQGVNHLSPIARKKRQGPLFMQLARKLLRIICFLLRVARGVAAMLSTGGTLLLIPMTTCAQRRDSAMVLPSVRITANKSADTRMSTPVQSLNRAQLDRINILSAADAARYFSGVLVKDYGGIGGLKTVSVRSLGAAATGILYDGIPVADMQSGQVDLGRFSSQFLQLMQVLPGSFLAELAPARAAASAATLQLQTISFRYPDSPVQHVTGGITYGSNQLWQPALGISKALPHHLVVAVDVTALSAAGNYPFTIDNGSYSTQTRRGNADVKSYQAEVNLLKLFADSSSFQVKSGAGGGVRGLPGAIVFFNNRSTQRLRENNQFSQLRFRKYINVNTQALFLAKYSRNWSRYTDPDFLNNQGGLDNRYTLQEGFASVALRKRLSEQLMIDAAADAAYTSLRGDYGHAGSPVRLSLWDNISIRYQVRKWQFRAEVLYASFHDDPRNGQAAVSRQRFTPAVALKFTPARAWLLRLFYKAVYRVPTFTDLYYGFVGNSNLKPELSRQINGGVTWEKNLGDYQVSITADAYYNFVTDKIITVPNQNLFTWTTLNLGKTRITGIDVNAAVSRLLTGGLTMSARLALTLQHAIDVSDPSSGTWKNRIPYTPDQSGSGILSAEWQRWTVAGSLLFSSNRYTLGENNNYNRLPAWYTPDLSVAYRFKFEKIPVSVKAALLDFTNQRYDIVRYYPMPGRSFRLTILFNQL